MGGRGILAACPVPPMPMTELFIGGGVCETRRTMMRGRRIGCTPLLGGILLLTATWGQFASPPAAEAQTVTRSVLKPQSPAGDVPAPQLSPGEREALLLRKLELRKQMAARENTNPPSPPGLPLVPGRQTQ